MMMTTINRITFWRRKLLSDESGPTSVEYAVMLALIIAVCITVITSIGNWVSETYTTLASAL